MLHSGRYTFQRATTENELEQIHRLNYWRSWRSSGLPASRGIRGANVDRRRAFCQVIAERSRVVSECSPREC